MATYIVHVKEVYTLELKVDADDITSARAKAEGMLHEVGDDVEKKYQFTMDSDEWYVERKEDD